MKTSVSFSKSFYSRISAIVPEQQNHQTQKPTIISHPRYFRMPKSDLIEDTSFKKCQQEYSDLMDGFICFAKDNANKIKPPLSADATKKIEAEFSELKNHLSDMEVDFFSNHKFIVYGAGKEMFHELDDLLRNEKLPIQKRLNAISAMAPQMSTCSGGILTVLQDAISSLKYSSAGIKGAAHRVKIQMIDSIIVEHVKKTHHGYLPGNEVHYVNAYFNNIAPSMGVAERNDEFISIAMPDITKDNFYDCKIRVFNKISPITLSKLMANDYLDQVKGAQKIDVNQPFAGDDLTAVFQITESVKKATLNREFGEVPMSSFLLEASNSDALEYKLSQQSTLIAKHFVHRLKEEKLVNYDDNISLTQSTERGSIKMLGNLFWRDHEGVCDELKAGELLEVPPTVIFNNLKNQAFDERERASIFWDIVGHVGESHGVNGIKNKADAWATEFSELFKQGNISAQEIVPAIQMALFFRCEPARRALTEAKASSNDMEKHGCTALMLATHDEDVTTLRALINAGSDLNARNLQGDTALMLAAKNGNAAALWDLAQSGADVNARNAQGDTALMLGAQNGKLGAVRLLIWQVQDINAVNARGFNAAMLAAQNGQSSVVEALICHGADINAQNEHGYTSTMLAALGGHAATLQVLVRSGADIDVMAPNGGASAAMFAALNGHSAALQVLIDAEADKDAKTTDGHTATMLAAESGHIDALCVLLRAGADKEAKNADGYTAAMLASVGDHSAALQELLYCGADVNCMSHGGNGANAMMLAALDGSSNALRVLINAGANTEAKTTEGYTATMLAAQNGHPTALKLLIDAQADIDAQTMDGHTAMMLAAESGHTSTLRLLIDHGANIDAKNAEGFTASMLAKQQGHANAVTLLENARRVDDRRF